MMIQNCTGCGRLTKEDHGVCDTCMRKGRVAQAIQLNTTEAVAKGLCTRCRLRKARMGKRTCAECINSQTYKRQLENDYYRKTAIELYGGKCECCGEELEEFLTLEHKGNWGKVHRQIAGANVIKEAVKLNDPTLFGILCMNCNFATRWGGACPHTITVEERLSRDAKAKTDKVKATLYHALIQIR